MFFMGQNCLASAFEVLSARCQDQIMVLMCIVGTEANLSGLNYIVSFEFNRYQVIGYEFQRTKPIPHKDQRPRLL
jgi:hypothetical protein